MITLVLMASGYGRRFGSNKLFYEIDGKAMYLHTLEKLNCLSLKNIGGHCLRPLVVTQYREIMDRAAELGIAAVFNREAEEGIAASVRLGARAAAGMDHSGGKSAAAAASEWIVYFTADQPYLEEETIEAFIAAAIHSGRSLASVCHGGRPGSPAMFYKNWYPALMDLQGDRGGRVIMKKNPGEVFWYEISDREITDIDYRE